MKIQTIALVIFLASSLSLSAQKNTWTIGLETGLRGEVCFTSDHNRNFWSGNQISTPPISLNFMYGLGEHFYLESGISYIKNQASYGFGAFDWGLYGRNEKQYLLYSSLQIPIALKYYFPLGKSKFSLFTKAGIAFSVPLQKTRGKNTYYPETYPERTPFWHDKETGNIFYDDPQQMVYSTTIYAPRKPLNLLLNVGLGFAYKFNFGLGLSIYAEYYSGVVDMAEISIPFRQEQYNYDRNEWNSYHEGTEYVTFRGDYWNIGFGISYTFKNKKKE